MYSLTDICIFDSSGISIPLEPANRHYQMMLDEIITDGAACWDGDIPAEIQAAADAKLFAQQLSAYKTARQRLEQYQLSQGRPEIREMQPTGEQTFDEATGEMVDVMQEVVVQTAIEPLEATVEVTVYPDDPMSAQEPTTQIVPNPLIVADDAERAEAQAVIDATPQAVAEAAKL